MIKMRGFLVGLGGGAVGAALVVLVLVLVFNFGEVKETVVQRAAETPAVYAPTTGGGQSPEQIYQGLSAGVVMVQSNFANPGSNVFGQPQSGQALGTGFVVDNNGYIVTKRYSTRPREHLTPNGHHRGQRESGARLQPRRIRTHQL